MILKIEDYERRRDIGENEKVQNGDQYQKIFWLYDDIQRVKIKAKRSLSNSKVGVEPDYKLIVKHPLEDGNPHYYNIIGVVTRDNKELLFAFDTTCYIMNDKGETLEIIR